MKVYMFPGQGSQFKGMGKEYFDEFPELVKAADRVLGYSIKELCLEDKNNVLNQTQYTQPALFTVSAMAYYHMIHKTGERPDYVIGHSLGEYNALLAAGVFDFETGLALVAERGRLMSQEKNGAMAAVLNTDSDNVERILRDNGLDSIDIANYNSNVQTVISGPSDDIDRAESVFTDSGCRFVRLNVSAAFHSRYMSGAHQKFCSYIRNVHFEPPSVPVISNVTARPYSSNESEIKKKLEDQLDSSVRWLDTICYLLSEGADEFVELGPGTVLTKLYDKIRKYYESGDYKISEKTVKPVIAETAVKTISKPVNVPVSVSRDESAYEIVERWNREHPVGTKIRCDAYDEILTTRSEAVVLFGHRAAVYVENYNGYFDIREISAVDG
jgi:malonyl CoA-acyl carrier protein transacylase